jgi:hypothetical protein
MRRVTLETPYRGKNSDELARNIAYAKACVLDCFEHDEAAFASHLHYPGILDDNIPTERQLGIEAGLLWGEAAEATVCYIDFGISPGMELGIEDAKKHNRPIEYRTLPNFHWPTVPYTI